MGNTFDLKQTESIVNFLQSNDGVALMINLKVALSFFILLAVTIADLFCQVTILLNKGAKVDTSLNAPIFNNLVLDEGMTALHIAAYIGDLDLVKLLVGRGAKINKKNKAGLAPVFLAIAGRHQNVKEYLLANGARWEDCIPPEESGFCLLIGG